MRNILSVIDLEKNMDKPDFLMKSEYLFVGMLSQYRIRGGDSVYIEDAIKRFKFLFDMANFTIRDHVFDITTISSKCIHK